MSSRTGTGRLETPAQTGVPVRLTATDVPVRVLCLACGDRVTIQVATRGRLAAMTNEQREILDTFTRTHAASQVAQ